MTATSGQPTLRALAVLGVAAIAFTLLPTSAQGQDSGGDSLEACPVDPPPEGFGDRDEIPAAHRDNVDCAAFLGIVLGFDDHTYGPALDVRRDQMASFIARTLEAADVQLPEPSEGADFTDVDDGNPHRDNIRRLEAAGVVKGAPLDRGDNEYGPALPTRRDQMTSLIIRGAEHAYGEEFSSDQQQFDDVDEGNAHFENVNFAAENGIVLGFNDITFGPGRHTRRDQMASFVVRLLNFLTTPAEVEITEQSAEVATTGQQISVTATVFDQFRDDPGDSRWPDGEDVTFQAEHASEEGVVVPPTQTVESDENGEAAFSFTAAQPGTVTVTASIDGPGGTFGHADGDDDAVDKAFTLETPVGENPGTIAGMVQDPDGQPVTGAVITFENGTNSATVSAPDGAYQSPPIQPGDYTVEVAGIEGVSLTECDPSAQEVSVEPGQDVDGIDFVCEAQLSGEALLGQL